MHADSLGAVAVLSPYKDQVVLMRALFQEAHGPKGVAGVFFATIDGFQVILLLQCLTLHCSPRHTHRLRPSDWSDGWRCWSDCSP